MKPVAPLLLSSAFAVLLLATAIAPTREANAMDMKGMDSKGVDMQGMGGDPMTARKNVGSAAHAGTAVIKGVDSAHGMVTLDHGPIKSLNWPAMTMGFKVKNKAMLNGIKPGDKVRFTVVQSGKNYVVTTLEQATQGHAP